MKNRSRFSIEVKIMDEHGRKIFHLKPARFNLAAGIEQTEKFLDRKLSMPRQKKTRHYRYREVDPSEEYVKLFVGGSDE